MSENKLQYSKISTDSTRTTNNIFTHNYQGSCNDIKHDYRKQNNYFQLNTFYTDELAIIKLVIFCNQEIKVSSDISWIK